MASRWCVCMGCALMGFSWQALAQSTADELAAENAESEARTKRAEARKSEADARKSEADADTAAMKSQLGGLSEYSIDGTASATSGAGAIEGSILASQAAQSAAKQIVTDVCAKAAQLCAAPAPPPAEGQPATDPPPAPTPPPIPNICDDLTVSAGTDSPKLYIYSEAEKPVFDSAEVVQAALCGMNRKLDVAIANSEIVNHGTSRAVGPSGIFTLISAAANLLRSDYSFQPITVTPDDLLLVKHFVAEASNRVSAPVFVPTLYRQAALTVRNPLMAAVTQMNILRDQAAKLSNEHNAKAASLGKGKNGAKAAKSHNDAAAQLDAAIKTYDEYLTKITTPSDKGISELAESARQSQVRKDLASGSYLLTLKMNAAGGLGYTKKNFWTFLGGAPFYVSGGAVASYALIEGHTGAVRGGGSYGVASDFKRIGELHGQ